MQQRDSSSTVQRQLAASSELRMRSYRATQLSVGAHAGERKRQRGPQHAARQQTRGQARASERAAAHAWDLAIQRGRRAWGTGGGASRAGRYGAWKSRSGSADSEKNNWAGRYYRPTRAVLPGRPVVPDLGT